MFEPKRVDIRHIEAEKKRLFLYKDRVTLKKWSKSKGFYGKYFSGRPYTTAHIIIAFRDGVCLPRGLEYKCKHGHWRIKASKNKIVYLPTDKQSLVDLSHSLAGHFIKWANVDFVSLLRDDKIKYIKNVKLMQQQMLDMAKDLEILMLKDLEKDGIFF